MGGDNYVRVGQGNGAEGRTAPTQTENGGGAPGGAPGGGGAVLQGFNPEGPEGVSLSGPFETRNQTVRTSGGGAISVNAEDNTLTFRPAGNFDHLGPGETVEVEFGIEMTAANGQTILVNGSAIVGNETATIPLREIPELRVTNL